jgi:hypothetical protein
MYANDYRFQSRWISQILFVVGFILVCLLALFGKAKANDNGTIPQANKTYLPIITNNGLTSSITITDSNDLTVTFDTLYVNTTITKSEKSALNYITMTNTKTMTNVTPLDMELGDLPHGTIGANAYSYTYHTATKDMACAQIKVAFSVGNGKARNVIGKACYKTLFSSDPDVQYHDLYLAVNDQAELIATPR